MTSSSSVDFCEPNYFASQYVAELHNSWSSMFIFAVSIVALYHNTSNEKRHLVLCSILALVGLGSTSLHAFLSSVSQGFDELPMLYMNMGLIYSLVELKSKKGEYKYPYLPMLMLLVAMIQAFVYFRFQEIYVVFLVNYVSSVVLLVFWTCRLTHSRDVPVKRYPDKRKYLWYYSICVYMLGSVLWIYEMNNCDRLLPYYMNANGMTFHILWHIGAGLGTYVLIMFLMYMRLIYIHEDNPNIDMEVTNVFGFLPTISIVQTSTKSE